MEIRIPVMEPDDSIDFADYFRARMELLSPALDLEVEEFDSRARIDSLLITSVELEEQAISIVYRLAFSASYTCTGIDYAATHDRTLRGVRRGMDWIFPIHQPKPERSTVDEF